MICLGNICRSTMAEIVLQQMLQQQQLAHVISLVDSCGTGGWHVGEEPDYRTISVCKKHYGKHLPILHRARQLRHVDVQQFDLLLCMDSNNVSNTQQICGKSDKIKLLAHFDPLKKSSIVEDPYYGDESDFEAIFEQITRCCSGVIDYVKQQQAQMP